MVAAVNDVLRLWLRQTVTRYGQRAYESPERCGSLLRPFAAEHPDEVAALVGASRENVITDLLAQSDRFPSDLLVEGLALRLQRRRDVAIEVARWAVEAWQHALGLGRFTRVSAPSAPVELDYPGLDTVCVVDTIADAVVMRERFRFLEILLRSIERQVAPKYDLRVGILSYGDYGHIRCYSGQLDFHPLEQCDLKDVEAAIRFLQALRPTASQDLEAAMEDALAALPTLSWRPENRRIVVMIGNRPPHPPKPIPGLRQVGSPSGRDWRSLLFEARQGLGLDSYAVLCPIFWPAPILPEHAHSYIDSCWHEIGYTALFDYEATTPDEVCRSILSLRS